MRTSAIQALLMVIITITVSMLLGGCIQNGAYEDARKDNLGAAVEEFDPSSISEVLCDAKGGQAGVTTGFERFLALADANSWGPVRERFEELGYSGTTNPERWMFSREDGFIASGSVVASAESNPSLTATLEGRGCSITAFPTEGAVVIFFEERTAG